MGKKTDVLINVIAGIHAVGATIFVDKRVKPNWLIKYEKHEWEIKKETGMNDAEIRRFFNVLIEYDVLENERKKI